MNLIKVNGDFCNFSSKKESSEIIGTVFEYFDFKTVLLLYPIYSILMLNLNKYTSINILS